MTKNEKQQLKEMLPRRWRLTIAERTGFSVYYVDKIMSGSSSQVEIEEATLNLAREHQEKIKRMETLKNELL